MLEKCQIYINNFSMFLYQIIYSDEKYNVLDNGYPIFKKYNWNVFIYLAFNYSNLDIVEYMKFNTYKIHYDAEFKLPE